MMIFLCTYMFIPKLCLYFDMVILSSCFTFANVFYTLTMTINYNLVIANKSTVNTQTVLDICYNSHVTTNKIK